jgi:hypothetical protein
MDPIFLESTEIKLSLAVWLVDENTGMPPIGGVRVFIKDKNVTAFKNRSGYYLFLDPSLPEGEHTVQVKSDYYFDAKTEVSLPLQDPGKVVEIILKPNQSYPFPR